MAINSAFLSKPCPGFKTTRLGAQASAVIILVFGICCIISAILAMYFTFRDNLENPNRRSHAENNKLQCYYGAGLAIYGGWAMFTCVMLFGIIVENKRALGFWMILSGLIPLYFIGSLIFLFAGSTITGWETQFLVCQGVTLIALVWAALAVWVYFGEIKRRDKNPELRENELMFAQPYMGAMPPDGAYNPGYGAPSAGSMSSIPRSQKSRHTYAPTEPAESVRGGSVGRQSRFDQYKAQRLPEKVPMTSDRSPEREGGTTYYRYQYNGEGKNTSHHGSQASLGSARDRHQPHQPPSYQAARFHRQTPPQPSATELYGSQGSLGGRQPYQPQHHASQGSLGGRQPYQPQHHASQGSLGGRQPYQPQHHASQGSLGGRQPYQPQHHASQGSLGGRYGQRFQVADASHSKDSEV